MANVVTNPDFTILDAGGDPLGWLMHSSQRCQTWEPLLTIGFRGTDNGDSSAGRGFQLAVGEEGRNELGLYPGLPYSGPGFDAGPGDVWQIAFTHQWAHALGNAIGIVNGALGNHCSIFFRYGVTIWNEATQHFDAWYASTPPHPVIQPASNLGGATPADGPGPIPYLETFTVPGNFPRATYQFAICVVPNTYAQAVWDDPNAQRGYKYWLWINDVDLELAAVGGDGDGSSPADSFYQFWPTPRYAPGSPGVIPNIVTPELGFDVGLEWDQFELSSAFPPQVSKSALPHVGVKPIGPGIVSAFAMFQDDSIGPVFLGPPTYSGWWLAPEGWWVCRGSAIPAEFGTSVVGLVRLPPTATADWPIQFPGFGDPFTFLCGAHRARLHALDYMVVGAQEYARRNILGSIEYVTLAPEIVSCYHPEIRPNGDSLTGSNNGIVADFAAVGLDQEFDYTLACEEVGGIHIDDHFTVVP